MRAPIDNGRELEASVASSRGGVTEGPCDQDVIDEAAGILMAQNQCLPHEALAILRAAARQGGVRLRTVAAELIEATQRPEPEPTTGTVPTPNEAEAVEAARMAAVARYDILDTPPDGAFDRIAGLAARLLRAPIATVSIVDTDRIWFKATHGLSGVSQVGRDPGLCSSAILRDGPYLVSDASTDPAAADNPLVRGDLGIRSYAAAPITTADGHRLGTVNVLDFRPRRVGDAELATLRDLAGMVMDQLELRLSALTTLRRERELRAQVERDKATLDWFAATLQRALRPSALPQVPGLEIASHHQPAEPRQVTGDFYDVFALDDGRWAFFLGDVEGHGAPAAVATALVRYTLRAAAMHDPNPVAALTELNTALLRDPDVPQCCTVLFGLLFAHPAGGFSITLGGGGHPPALWLRPATLGHGPAFEQVWPAGGTLVGALPDAAFSVRRLHLRPGQTLLLHTDGLTEARPGGTFFGEDGLIDFLNGRTERNAYELIAGLADLIQQFDPPPADDVALLALGVPLPR